MNRPLRALLLAAGLGTRLRPLTLKTPKCLVPLGGEPLLGRWLHTLEEAGCESVLVNTHYLADQVDRYLEGWKSPTMRVQSVHEPELLGTAGTLMANQGFFAGSTGLLIHADNLMAEDLRTFLRAHENRAAGCLLTMLTFETDTPRSCGIVEIDDQLIVRAFYEKIMNPPSSTANGALYAFDPPLLDYLNRMATPPRDFSTEVIPSLMGRIQTCHTDQVYMDIGTPQALVTAQQMFN